MALSGVREQFMQQITIIGTLPEMVMRIDDRQFRFKNLLGRTGGEPGIVRRMNAPEPGGLS